MARPQRQRRLSSDPPPGAEAAEASDPPAAWTKPSNESVAAAVAVDDGGGQHHAGGAPQQHQKPARKLSKLRLRRKTTTATTSAAADADASAHAAAADIAALGRSSTGSPSQSNLSLQPPQLSKSTVASAAAPMTTGEKAAPAQMSVSVGGEKEPGVAEATASPANARPAPDIGRGWTVSEVKRRGGRTAGQMDRYWHSPCGQTFRSRAAIRKFVDADALAAKGPTSSAAPAAPTNASAAAAAAASMAVSPSVESSEVEAQHQEHEQEQQREQQQQLLETEEEGANEKIGANGSRPTSMAAEGEEGMEEEKQADTGPASTSRHDVKDGESVEAAPVRSTGATNGGARGRRRSGGGGSNKLSLSRRRGASCNDGASVARGISSHSISNSSSWSAKEDEDRESEGDRGALQPPRYSVGTRISKVFEDGKAYRGVIASYDGDAQFYVVEYDDGDKEDMDDDDVARHLLLSPRPPATATAPTGARAGTAAAAPAGTLDEEGSSSGRKSSKKPSMEQSQPPPPRKSARSHSKPAYFLDESSAAAAAGAGNKGEGGGSKSDGGGTSDAILASSRSNNKKKGRGGAAKASTEVEEGIDTERNSSSKKPSTEPSLSPLPPPRKSARAISKPAYFLEESSAAASVAGNKGQGGGSSNAVSASSRSDKKMKSGDTAKASKDITSRSGAKRALPTKHEANTNAAGSGSAPPFGAKDAAAAPSRGSRISKLSLSKRKMRSVAQNGQKKDDGCAPKYSVGTVISKVFENGKAYRGVIASYDQESKFYVVEYDDGDKEEMDDIDVALHLLPGKSDTGVAGDFLEESSQAADAKKMGADKTQTEEIHLVVKKPQSKTGKSSAAAASKDAKKRVKTKTQLAKEPQSSSAASATKRTNGVKANMQSTKGSAKQVQSKTISDSRTAVSIKWVNLLGDTAHSKTPQKKEGAAKPKGAKGRPTKKSTPSSITAAKANRRASLNKSTAKPSFSSSVTSQSAARRRRPVTPGSDIMDSLAFLGCATTTTAGPKKGVVLSSSSSSPGSLNKTASGNGKRKRITSPVESGDVAASASQSEEAKAVDPKGGKLSGTPTKSGGRPRKRRCVVPLSLRRLSSPKRKKPVQADGTNSVTQTVEAEWRDFECARLSGERQTLALRIRRLKEEIRALGGQGHEESITRKITWKKYECANLEEEESRVAKRLEELSRGKGIQMKDPGSQKQKSGPQKSTKDSTSKSHADGPVSLKDPEVSKKRGRPKESKKRTNKTSRVNRAETEEEGNAKEDEKMSEAEGVIDGWECHLCRRVNDPEKKRCSDCKGWKGGKSVRYGEKRSTSSDAFEERKRPQKPKPKGGRPKGSKNKSSKKVAALSDSALKRQKALQKRKKLSRRSRSNTPEPDGSNGECDEAPKKWGRPVNSANSASIKGSKAQFPMQDNDSDEEWFEDSPTEQPRKRRGRPPKKANGTSTNNNAEFSPQDESDEEWFKSLPAEPPRKARGRPRKDSNEEKTQYGRWRPCESCIGCLQRSNCGRCLACQDNPEFGGEGRLINGKNICIQRQCLKPVLCLYETGPSGAPRQTTDEGISSVSKETPSYFADDFPSFDAALENAPDKTTAVDRSNAIFDPDGTHLDDAIESLSDGGIGAMEMSDMEDDLFDGESMFGAPITKNVGETQELVEDMTGTEALPLSSGNGGPVKTVEINTTEPGSSDTEPSIPQQVTVHQPQAITKNVGENQEPVQDTTGNEALPLSSGNEGPADISTTEPSSSDTEPSIPQQVTVHQPQGNMPINAAQMARDLRRRERANISCMLEDEDDDLSSVDSLGIQDDLMVLPPPLGFP